MKKHQIPIVILTVLAAFSLQTCKHCTDPTNPDCANYNPCHEDQPPTAEFGMFERIMNGNCFQDGELENRLVPIPNGWPVWNRAVTFRTEITDYDSLTWQIGDHNEILRGPEVFLQFHTFLGQSMPVTLTVYRTSRKGCYDESQSVATQTQTLNFKNMSDDFRVKPGEDPEDSLNWQGPYTGKFFCTEETTGDTFTLDIYEHNDRWDITITGFNGEYSEVPFASPLDLFWEITTYSLTFCDHYAPESWPRHKWREQRGTIHYSRDYNEIQMTYWESIDPLVRTTSPGGTMLEPSNNVEKRLTGIRIE